jgi:hypothetical protein
MDGDRIEKALARIEAASRRIEAAASRRSPATAEGDPELQRKYDALREQAGTALAELDRLLGALG